MLRSIHAIPVAENILTLSPQSAVSQAIEPLFETPHDTSAVENQLVWASMAVRHRGPNLRMAHMTMLLAAAMTPNPVNNQPLPMASSSG